MTEDRSTNAPIQTLRDGRLKAAIWQNDSDKGPFHTVTLTRIYEDSAGKLQESASFSAMPSPMLNSRVKDRCVSVNTCSNAPGSSLSHWQRALSPYPP